MATYNYQGCWNDTGNRAIPWYVGNMSPQQCEQTAYDTGNSVYGLQYYGQCFVGNSLQQAQEYGQAYGGNSAACGPQGNSWTNQVYAALPYTMPNYQMSPAELTCYAQNNPDLAANGVVSNEQLQQHWTIFGANEQRNNQCPAYQTTSGLYNYVGCFEGVYGYTFRENVNSINECEQIANNNGDMAFALYNGTVCSTNASNSNGFSANTGANREVSRNLCSAMGTPQTAQIYVRGQPFPPPPPPLPSLQNQNFSNTTNTNES